MEENNSFHLFIFPAVSTMLRLVFLDHAEPKLLVKNDKPEVTDCALFSSDILQDAGRSCCHPVPLGEECQLDSCTGQREWP